MTDDVRVLDRVLEMTFTSDGETADRLRRLVASLELPFDNIAARWALSRSLAEGPLPDVHIDEHAPGKELRGRTLFGAAETAALLVAELLLVEGVDRTNEHLRELVLGHWRRGQALLAADMDGAFGDPDVLIKQSIDRILGPRFVDVDLSVEIIGQERLVSDCNELLRSAGVDGAGGQVCLGEPILIAGPRGSGRTHIALSVARAVAGECVVVNARHVRTMSELRSELHERIPGVSAATAVIEDLDHATPALVRGLAKAARDGRIKPWKGQEIDPFSVIGVADEAVAAKGWKRFALAPYDRDALAQILRSHYGWHLEVRRLVALAGRLRPGLALRRAADLERLAGTPRVTDRHAALALENWGLDRLGLDETDRAVMSALGSGEAVSLSQLSDTVAVGPARLADFVLPYLAELALIEESSPGEWRATAAGVDVYGGQR